MAKRTKPQEPKPEMTRARMLAVAASTIGHNLSLVDAEMILDLVAVLEKRGERTDIRDLSEVKAAHAGRLVDRGMLLPSQVSNALRVQFVGYGDRVEMKEPLTCTGRYSIDRFKTADGAEFFRRTNERFSGAELMALLHFAASEVEHQVFNDLRPVTERIVLQPVAAHPGAPSPGEGTHGAGSDNTKRS